jgi:hypothetical protein
MIRDNTNFGVMDKIVGFFEMHVSSGQNSWCYFRSFVGFKID